MRSKSSRPKKDLSKLHDRVAALLQHGAVFRNPAPELVAAADLLRDLGIISTEFREFVSCANPTDGDYPPKNRHCRGRIPIESSLAESGGELRCPDCERSVYPATYRKQRHSQLRTLVKHDDVSSFLVAKLQDGGITSTRIVDGVFRLDVGIEGVTMCIVDICRDANYASRERALHNRTCFVAISSRDVDDHFLNEDWVVRTTVAEIVCGRADLVQLVTNAAAIGLPTAHVVAAIPVWMPGPTTVTTNVNRTPVDRRFVVEVGDGIVRIEGLKVISEQARPRFIIFDTLWRVFLDDLGSDLAPAAFRPRSLAKLIEELSAQTGKEHPDELTVRRVINNMQTDFQVRLRRELGLPADREDIVQTIRNKGQTDANFGYRINPFTVAARAFRPNLSQES